MSNDTFDHERWAHLSTVLAAVGYIASFRAEVTRGLKEQLAHDLAKAIRQTISGKRVELFAVQCSGCGQEGYADHESEADEALLCPKCYGSEARPQA
jgi:hypothetical protein